MKKHFGFEMDEDIIGKFRYICEYYGRSQTKQLNFLIRMCIEEYEKEHGKIDIGELRKSE